MSHQSVEYFLLEKSNFWAILLYRDNDKKILGISYLFHIRSEEYILLLPESWLQK